MPVIRAHSKHSGSTLQILLAKCIDAADESHQASLEQFKRKKQAVQQQQQQQASASNDIYDDDEKMPAVHRALDDSMIEDPGPIVHEEPFVAESQSQPHQTDVVMTSARTQSNNNDSQMEIDREQINAAMRQELAGMQGEPRSSTTWLMSRCNHGCDKSRMKETFSTQQITCPAFARCCALALESLNRNFTKPNERLTRCELRFQSIF